MFIWRSLSPSAIVACINYLVSRSEQKKSERKPEADDPRAESETAQIRYIDQATVEIRSRL